MVTFLTKHLALVLVVPLLIGEAFASDVWVVQGSALAATPDPCFFTTWTGDVLFFNTTASQATIRLLGTSDTAPATERTSFVIAPQQAATLDAEVQLTWRPASQPPIWVDHLDVPDGVRIESRLELGEADCSLRPPAGGGPLYGKLSFPVTRSLANPGTRQLLLGADNGAADSRINIGVYNAGSVAAAATLEVHRACDDALLASQTVTIPANQLVQTTLYPSKPVGPCGDTRATLWANYATVVVDQPSFSYVSTLSNDPLATYPPVLRIPAAISFTQ